MFGYWIIFQFLPLSAELFCDHRRSGIASKDVPTSFPMDLLSTECKYSFSTEWTHVHWIFKLPLFAEPDFTWNSNAFPHSVYLYSFFFSTEQSEIFVLSMGQPVLSPRIQKFSPSIGVSYYNSSSCFVFVYVQPAVAVYFLTTIADDLFFPPRHQCRHFSYYFSKTLPRNCWPHGRNKM